MAAATVLGPLILKVAGLVFTRGPSRSGGTFRLTIDRLDVFAGQICAVTGPSGTGKTTLLQLLGLQLRPERVGEFLLAGVDVAGLWKAARQREIERLRCQRIGYALQHPELLPSLSMEENVAVPGHLNRMRGIDERVAQLLAELSFGDGDLQRVRSHRPQHLSGGQAQRAGLARALVHRPCLVYADEPTGNLDDRNARRALECLRRHCQEEGAAVVLATHDQKLAREYADRIVELGAVSGGIGIVADEHLA